MEFASPKRPAILSTRKEVGRDGCAVSFSFVSLFVNVSRGELVYNRNNQQDIDDRLALVKYLMIWFFFLLSHLKKTLHPHPLIETRSPTS